MVHRAVVKNVYVWIMVNVNHSLVIVYVIQDIPDDIANDVCYIAILFAIVFAYNYFCFP